MHSPPPRRAAARDFSGTYESLPARSVQVRQPVDHLSPLVSADGTGRPQLMQRQRRQTGFSSSVDAKPKHHIKGFSGGFPTL